ncbi:MAG: isochorismatase [Microbacterium sp. SCN 70-200]|uniref:cysteine hydrolase family protein n=1 Tax=unclassified Microbacterium TaxID=2609290 RepID=UPI00086E1B06|nr:MULTISPECIES: cysteine hydrolase family protein [unclassified Microbacterium]MBN9214964.1 cysteine hydrolase [Microbacterium sp.]ODT42943.1 MAG: isochorismatase [Microbacterium sp. SCN 70-200]OJV84751.1 MAG: cysteine hydrolase [Microbacterium sp. 70-16]
MSTRSEGTATALLVVDVQNDVMDAAWEREAVITRIAALVERARSESVPIVWVQHDDEGMPVGTHEWQIVDQLAPAAGEPRVRKQHGDSFEGTDLEEVLAQLGVSRVVVAGAETDACIRSTIHGAFARGYDTVLVGDAHTSNDKTPWGAPTPAAVAAHTNLYWGFQSAPDKLAGVADAAEVRLSA